MMTHMPFLTRDRDGERVLLFCEAERVAEQTPRWKLHFQLGGEETRRLDTGFAEDVVECCPTGWNDDDGWHVSFIAGMALHRMDGPRLEQLRPPQVAYGPTRAGFVHRNRLVHAEEGMIRVLEPSGNRSIELGGAMIYRVAYRADAPDTLLISGRMKTQTEVFAVEHDLATGRQEIVVCDDRPAYKHTVLGDEILYAERFGDGFEDRRIVSAKTTQRVGVSMAC